MAGKRGRGLARSRLPFIGVVLACLMVIAYTPWVPLALRDLVYR